MASHPALTFCWIMKNRQSKNQKKGVPPATRVGPSCHTGRSELRHNGTNTQETLSVQRTDGVRENSGFAGVGNSAKSRSSERIEKLANRLYDGLAKKRLIQRHPGNLVKWESAFIEFLRRSDYSLEEFEEVLSWYAEHVGEEYIPKAYSAQSFCDLFVRIFVAKQRYERENPAENQNNAVEMPTIRMVKTGLSDEEFLRRAREA